jgi:pre-mRNA-splicing factor 18
LQTRGEVEKHSSEGVEALSLFQQTKRHLNPLLQKLGHKNCPSDILPHLYAICNHIVEEQWVKANDAYLKLAIGNAPWPMGVANVGIHERSSRDKLFNDKIARK